MTERGRPRLSIGTFGKMTSWSTGTRARPNYIAKARFRDLDGVTRPVTASGQTKRAAEEALQLKLAKRQRAVQASTVTDEMSVADLARLWLEQGRAGRLGKPWATNTGERYALAAAQITVAVGARRVRELNRAGVNTALTAIVAKHGAGAAKSAKSALSGMCKLALLYDALESNPVRDTLTIRPPRKSAPRALTPDETTDLCDRIRTDDRAVHHDLPDLVEWMLCTGARIGECCAARAAVVDLEAGTWEINATAVRVKGEGMTIQPRTKSDAGWRVIALPRSAVDILQRRGDEEGWRLTPDGGVFFGAPFARAIRDPSNTSGDLRDALDRLGYDWVSSHTFRKTVATRLEEAGLTPRQVADHLGHANPSMTLDVYFGRQVVSAEAATILNRT